MAEQYYKPTDFDLNYPTVIKSIVEAIKVYVCDVFYPREEYRLSQNRFILTDFTGGDDVSIRKSIEQFKTSQAQFPFTAYGIWDNNLIAEKTSHKSKSGLYYSSLYECYVKTFPAKITIPMVSFFATAADYERAFQLLYNEAATATRVNVPLTVNENLVYFPINIDFAVSKGSFAGQFDQYLKIGNIWGMSHNFIITFYYFSINADDQHGNTVRIAPVDDMYANFYAFNNPDYRDNPMLVDHLHAYVAPEVEITVPAEAATGVSRTASIVINFNVAMNEASVLANTDFDPFMSVNFNWNDASTILTLEVVETLAASTAYEIMIAKEVNSDGGQNLFDDFTLNFTTGS